MRKVEIRTLEGNPNNIKGEILLKRNYSTGKIDLLKRNSKGILESITENSNILASPVKGLTSVAAGDEFDAAFEALLALAESYNAEGKYTEQTLTPEMVADIAVMLQYLPNKTESVAKGTNKINVSGYADATGFVVSTGATMLKCANGADDKVTLVKVILE